MSFEAVQYEQMHGFAARTLKRDANRRQIVTDSSNVVHGLIGLASCFSDTYAVYLSPGGATVTAEKLGMRLSSGVFRISVRRGRRRRWQGVWGVVEGSMPIPEKNHFCLQSDNFGCISRSF